MFDQLLNGLDQNKADLAKIFSLVLVNRGKDLLHQPRHTVYTDEDQEEVYTRLMLYACEVVRRSWRRAGATSSGTGVMRRLLGHSPSAQLTEHVMDLRNTRETEIPSNLCHIGETYTT